MILITPVAAPEPYKVDAAPFKTSILSIWFISIWRKSKSPLKDDGSFTFTPSIKIATCLFLPPLI